MTRAQQIRARLWRPPNAVPDRGIDLGGKDVKRALDEIAARKAAETAQQSEAKRRREKEGAAE